MCNQVLADVGGLPVRRGAQPHQKRPLRARGPSRAGARTCAGILSSCERGAARREYVSFSGHLSFQVWTCPVRPAPECRIAGGTRASYRHPIPKSSRNSTRQLRYSCTGDGVLTTSSPFTATFSPIPNCAQFSRTRPLCGAVRRVPACRQWRRGSFVPGSKNAPKHRSSAVTPSTLPRSRTR